MLASRARPPLPAVRPLRRLHTLADWAGYPVADFFANIGGNAVAAGGLTVLAAAAALTALRTTGAAAADALLKRVVVRAEFDSRDDAYRWMTHWLAGNEKLRDQSRRFTVVSTLKRLGGEGQSTSDQGVYLIPSGSSVVNHCGRWILIRRERDDDGKSAKEREKLVLSFLLGTRGDVTSLVHEAKAQYDSALSQRTAVLALDEYGSWTPAGSKVARPLASVVLNDANQAQNILADCKRFLNAEAQYASRGVPYRRGYLLHGAPGTGKTSMVLALAGALKLKVHVVSAVEKLNDSAFADALRSAAAPSILLLEDIDAAFVTRPTVLATGGLTFSGLLNALDGVMAQEGCLVFMTTNHVERLDAALVRPGRVDFRLEFKLCTPEAAERYARHFYRGHFGCDTVARQIRGQVPDNLLSAAALQAALSTVPDSPQEALHAVVNAVWDAQRAAASFEKNAAAATHLFERPKPL
ncbi:P-loop containing nucleoside triphosphate hydrolase protein [Pelagophyceae sp. CCMP2097]|nr:P-loop containing nucleoside triphosphate hydrolase protein [Pelagophyceae sp. CCMP2097]